MHNDALARELEEPAERCSATHPEEGRCMRPAGHAGYHSSGGVGRPGVSWPQTVPEPELELYATSPWTKHRFPLERGAPRISWKVLTATSGPYRCQGLPELPAGHVQEIPRGARHVRVALRPWKGRRWRDHRLCRACGLAARLATEARPPDDGTHTLTSSGRWTRAPANDHPPNDSEPS